MLNRIRENIVLNRNSRLIEKIVQQSAVYQKQTDSQLRQHCRDLQFEASANEPISKLLVSSFGLIHATVIRTTGMTPYHTQVNAGIQLCHPCIVEMATGEGKTLTALLPTFIKSLDKKGLLFATSNDYLARRDADHAREVFGLLGVTVGCIQSDDEDDDRRNAYQCNITYGTISQFGFDFLRDRAKLRYTRINGPSDNATPVGRPTLNSLIADEADDSLIDEAATPLVIASSPQILPPHKSRLFEWAREIAPAAIQKTHYIKDPIKDKVELTDDGRAWVRQQSRSLNSKYTSLLDLFKFVEQAILVFNDFERDVKYIVRDGEIIIVDENTGRLGIGREWSDGMQQAIQAKEELPITGSSNSLAKVSVQNFVRSFKHVSGMTGTAAQSAREFKKIYKLKVRPIPTYRPCIREVYPTRAFATQAQAFEKTKDEVVELTDRGRAILVGTRTIHVSEQFSEFLNLHNIEHILLNAKNDEQEAEIISRAGEEGQIIVATNMAGRGTDIKLPSAVEKAGGLHVIALGIHKSKRIDRQLVGRAARQGDPGSCRTVLFLEDDLLDAAFGPLVAATYRNNLNAEKFSQSRCISLFQKAQKKISQRMESNRASMLHQEKKQVKQIANAGLDPVLEVPS